MPQPLFQLAKCSWLAPLCASLASAGCTYDWTVAPSPGSDGGQGGSAGDAGQDVQVSTECLQIISSLEQMRSSLKDCVPGGGMEVSCSYPVTDECGCSFYVAKPIQASSYNGLVDDFEEASCSVACELCAPEALFYKCEENPDGAQARCVPAL